MFIPDKESQKTDLMATSGDYLRIWQIHDAYEEAKKLELKSLLNNRPKDEYCVPLTFPTISTSNFAQGINHSASFLATNELLAEVLSKMGLPQKHKIRYGGGEKQQQQQLLSQIQSTAKTSQTASAPTPRFAPTGTRAETNPLEHLTENWDEKA
jgi:hypothetical protein